MPVIVVGLAVIVGVVLLVRRGLRTPSSTVDARAGAPPGAVAEVGGGLPTVLGAPLTTDPAAGQIVVEHLSKAYGSVQAVKDISFTVQPGRITGFLGPNGAGKTTTLRLLLNLVTPTAGSATIGGARYADLARPIRRVGAVLEASSAHKARTGRNHLRVICQAAGVPLERADEVLELVGLAAAGGRKFREYSLGMRQRLGIAAALIGDPGVLILDEPTNGLDPEGIRWMRDLLRALAASGRTILVSSHLLSEMQMMADDLVILAAGQVVAQGPVETVLGSLSSARTLVRTPDVEQLTEALDGAVVTPGEDGELYVSGPDAQAIGEAAQRAGVVLHQLTTQRPDLESVFLDLTSGKAAIR
jgi:ABC-2 type transport system ATP-binding protein